MTIFIGPNQVNRTANGHEVSSWGGKNALELDSGDVFTT